MREINKFIRRKLGNKKQYDETEERDKRRRNFTKPDKYYKQEIENKIDEYYRTQSNH